MEGATMVYPPAAVDVQIDSMVEDFQSQLKRSNWQFQDYLNLQGITEEDLREDFRENAESQLRHQIALRQFILDEKLQVKADDINAQLEERIGQYEEGELRDIMRNYFSRGSGLEAITGEVLSNKTYERILAIFSGNAPDLSTLDDEEEAADEEE